ncbi:hypothetical protein BGE01nite_06890 [Brevifollis gellanilyticus]|uniref:Uncharacterized protein n=1 Tax=Brevifollis gellanilyticus TaxID=748831 RepID=A0A512M3V9_9BACT|nr:hypothetical protein BGE01nite_06890 [Brevifollis gellanilyticus]
MLNPKNLKLHSRTDLTRMKRLFIELQFALHETARLFSSALGRSQDSPAEPFIMRNDGCLDPP